MAANTIDNVSVRSGSTHTADTGGGESDVTGTSSSGSSQLVTIPITPISDNTPEQQQASASQLPSRKFQFSVWHDLRSMGVHGSELKAPRVRRGPAEKEAAFYLMVDEENNKLHHDLHGHQRHRHRDTLENWERTKLASFTCQDLHHGYQTSNAGRILDRLKDATFINLRDNAFTDLSGFTFARCEYLNLDRNFLASFKNLPGLKKVRHLTAMDNDIASFTGLSRLSNLPLEELYLMGNPVAFQMGYRQKVFAVLPRLKFLDGVARQAEDMEEPPIYPPEHRPPDQNSCIIS